jgi:hypothetical protein
MVKLKKLKKPPTLPNWRRVSGLKIRLLSRSDFTYFRIKAGIKAVAGGLLRRMATSLCAIPNPTVPLGIGAVVLLEAIEYQLGEVAGLGTLTSSLLHLANG